MAKQEATSPPAKKTPNPKRDEPRRCLHRGVASLLVQGGDLDKARVLARVVQVTAHHPAARRIPDFCSPGVEIRTGGKRK